MSSAVLVHDLEALKREAEAISRALVARGEPGSAEAHLEEVRAGYYEDERECTHLDLAAAYASLAKAGARAISIRMEIADPPE